MGKAFKVRLKADLNCDRFHSDLLAIYVRLQQDVSMTTNTGDKMSYKHNVQRNLMAGTLRKGTLIWMDEHSVYHVAGENEPYYFEVCGDLVGFSVHLGGQWQKLCPLELVTSFIEAHK